jgi:hypothetical protein
MTWGARPETQKTGRVRKQLSCLSFNTRFLVSFMRAFNFSGILGLVYKKNISYMSRIENCHCSEWIESII